MAGPCWWLCRLGAALRRALLTLCGAACLCELPSERSTAPFLLNKLFDLTIPGVTWGSCFKLPMQGTHLDIVLVGPPFLAFISASGSTAVTEAG